jgi:hypothetical protein
MILGFTEWESSVEPSSGRPTLMSISLTCSRSPCVNLIAHFKRRQKRSKEHTCLLKRILLKMSRFGRLWVQRTLAANDGEVFAMQQRLHLCRRHHAVVRTVSSAAGRQARLRRITQRGERREQRKGECRQQQDGKRSTQALCSLISFFVRDVQTAHHVPFLCLRPSKRG